MLERKLEPEVMDTKEDAIDYDSMDHSEVNRVFVQDLLEDRELKGDVLDLGTGTALIPIELCRQCSEVRVMAIDLSIEMLEVARYNLEIHGQTQSITLDHVDSKDLPYEDELFDVVISNSIVHHIPNPKTVLAEAVRVVRPGGLLFFRDLLRPSTQEELDHLVATYAGDDNDHQRQLFADSLHAALTVEEMQALVVALGFDASEVHASSDRHWTWSAMKPE